MTQANEAEEKNGNDNDINKYNGPNLSLCEIPCKPRFIWTHPANIKVKVKIVILTMQPPSIKHFLQIILWKIEN